MKTKIRLIGNHCVHPGGFYQYQSYYIQGFKALEQVDFNIVPIYSKFCASLSEGQIKGATKLWRLCNSIAGNNCSIESDHVGRYVFELGTNSVKVAIDVADGKNIRDMNAYEWSDLYFKANKWEKIDYPQKVMPLVNGNGSLNSSKLKQVKCLRNRAKEIDLVFMSLIYASTSKDMFYNNIEHHVRLFETLSKIKCNKYLLSVIPEYYPADMIGKYIDRLERAGVPWQYSWDGMPSVEFWDHLARAHTVFLRPGKHACISWRMIDLLCMGACIVSDTTPYPNWPIPIVNGKNYISCDCGLGMDESLPPPDRYEKIIETVEALLADKQKISTIQTNNCHYYDNYATPERVADYIIQTVKHYSMNVQVPSHLSSIRTIPEGYGLLRFNK